jgi:ABC-type amino acid transport substrate-binding protein
LAGKVVAVQRDTIAFERVDVLRRQGVAIRDVVVVPGTIDPVEADCGGDAEVALVHEPVGRYFAGRDDRLTVTGSVSHALDPQPLGIVFSQQDGELQAAVARAIKAMKQDQSFVKLLEDWFGP